MLENRKVIVSEYFETKAMISTRTGINDGSATLGPDTMVFSAEREKSSQFGTIFTGPAKSQIALIEVILKCHFLKLLHLYLYLKKIENTVSLGRRT